jgi:hypothetical protein
VAAHGGRTGRFKLPQAMTTFRARQVPRGVVSRYVPSPFRASSVTGVFNPTGKRLRSAKSSRTATNSSRVRKPSGSGPLSVSPGMTDRPLGVFIRKESQRCVRQVSPIRRRSKTRWHTSARFNALLTPSPAQPAPTTTAGRASGLLVIVKLVRPKEC